MISKQKIKSNRSDIYDFKRLVQARRGEISELQLKDLPYFVVSHESFSRLTKQRKQAKLTTLRSFVNWCGENKIVFCPEVSHATTTNYLNYLQLPDEKGAVCSSGTIHNHLKMVSSVFNLAGVLPDWITNPFG